MVSAGITEVIFIQEYRDPAGVNLLHDAKISTLRIDVDD